MRVGQWLGPGAVVPKTGVRFPSPTPESLGGLMFCLGIAIGFAFGVWLTYIFLSNVIFKKFYTIGFCDGWLKEHDNVEDGWKAWKTFQRNFKR